MGKEIRVEDVSLEANTISIKTGARSQSASGTGPCAPAIAVALEEYFAELSLDAKEAGDLFGTPA